MKIIRRNKNRIRCKICGCMLSLVDNKYICKNKKCKGDK